MSNTKNTTVPIWFWVAAVLGLAWNLFGIVQFISTAGASVDALVKSGMTLEQAQFYVKLPIWLTIVFAVGVFGGTLGCVLLLMRKQSAAIVLLVSLVAYILLFASDAALGVFTVMGMQQLVILSTVVLIAIGLWWLGIVSKRRGFLV